MTVKKMADVSKAHQLSAARKKLREYQKHKKSRANEGEDSRTPAESLTDSTHSSLNEVLPSNISPLQNYFGNEGYANTKEPTSFFDNFASKATPHSQEFPPAENIHNKGESPTLKTGDEDVLTLEDPEINPNVIYDHLHADMPSEVTLSVDGDGCKDDSVGNMEALKQLSTQIIQLIDDSSTPTELTSQLDNTNQALLAALQKEQAQNELKLQVLEQRVLQLQGKNTHLEEQLACHQQTVNILVTEKAELTSTLTKNENVAKDKTAECKELSARLKTSRSRVADLEKELNVFRTEKSKHDEKGLEYANLLSEHETLKQQQEEALQDISELQGKLSASLSEKSQLQRDVQDLNSQVSLLNVKVQQLSTAENTEFSGKIESLTQHNAGLEKQIAGLQDTIKVLTSERDQASLQYQRYVQQLNNQTSVLAQKLEAKTEENEALVSREQQLTDQIGELEKVLQRLQNEQQPSSKSSVESKKELEEAHRTIEDLQSHQVGLEEKYDQVTGERDELFRELESKKYDLVQLEEAVEQLKQDQPDNVKLLASIESDKVAASRAVAQNTELKKQLEEMQEAFIKMSNDKLELTERLNDEHHKSKDLHEKLDQFESQIHTLTDAIEIKDREMVSLRESAAELNKYVLQQNQLEDRLRHYEAHDHSTHALQFELQESYKRIQNLKIENEKLETRIENMEKRRDAENSRNNLEGVDRVALQNKIDELERINKHIELKLTQNNNNIFEESERKGDDSILSKETAMVHLEEKFAKTMQDIANLQDEKQRLEHLVLQLQSETETIGEYVALYQHQRGILKQRALEREEQLRQLSLDRELMKHKLNQLNQLIKALLVENGALNTDLLNRQVISTSKLCTEHAKLHEEINSGVQNGALETGKRETAEKIIELLGEIKTSNLVQPFETSESFHPCPWCSGQLITV